MQYKIPTWSPSKQWHYTEFESTQEFREYLKTIFKEPGRYQFDVEISKLFNEHSRTFQKKGIYCEYQEGTAQYINYWDTEKEKCRKGVIFKDDNGNDWYLSRSYYHWLNFLQIYDKRKEVKGFAFPQFRDVQYHICLYEELAELHGKNACILKRRQVASSYLHIARIFNKYIFEQGFTAKIGASDKGYIEGQKGCWKYLNHYRDFTNTKTAWIRYNDPDAVYKWQQRIKNTTEDRDGVKRDSIIGTQATIVGLTFDKDPVKGVGGAIDEFFYEEGGVAPTADQTYNYLKEAMKEGTETTGFFAIAGSVGDLDQCEPLRKFIEHPEANDFYGVTTTLKDETGQEAVTGLFIPIFWGLSGQGDDNFIDEAGNSLVEAAKAYIDKKYAEDKKKLSPSDYQTQISQGPRTIAEAIATRTESIFPLRYTAAQIRKIEENEYWLHNCELERIDGKIIEKPATREPNTYPSSKTKVDKRGCLVIHERPIEDAPFKTYYGSVDPIEVGKSVTSDSMASIYIWKDSIEVIKQKSDGTSEVFLEGGKLVAEWVGRYDDPNETNEMLSMIVEWYNAWTTSENNKTSFINYMRIKRRQRYLAKKSDMMFDKEMKVVQNEFQEYGWTKTQAMWNKIIEYGIDAISETEDKFDDKNQLISTYNGYERFPFIWLMREMQAYNEKGNFDRIVAFCALMAFVNIQKAIRGGLQRRIERTEDTSERTKEMYDQIKNRSPFNNIGRYKPASKVRRSAFHNIR